MQIRDLMSTNIISVTPNETAAFAARLLARHNVGALPVCSEEGALRGIVTDRDIVLRCVAAETPPADTLVREIMTKYVVTAAPGDDPREATRLMAADRIRRLPVVENGKVVGMISLGDLVKSGRYDMEASRALSEISSNVRRL